MSVQINIKTDTKDLLLLLQQLAYIEKYEIPTVIRQSTKNIERNSKLLIRTGSRLGIKYPNLPNRSSKPGEAPKTQSGRLAASIKSSFVSRRGYTEGTIGSSAPHAEWLDQPNTQGAIFRFGNNSILERRPIFRPVIEKELPLMAAEIVRRII